MRTLYRKYFHVTLLHLLVSETLMQRDDATGRQNNIDTGCWRRWPSAFAHAAAE